MSLTELVEYKEDLIFIAGRADIPHFILSAVAEFPSVCVVSDRFPLLANLNVIENITLYNMYNENVSLSEAAGRIKPYLSDLNIDDILLKRKESLTRKELIDTYILRCLSRGCEFVLTDFEKISDIKLLRERLDEIRKRIFLRIICSQDDTGILREFNYKRISV
jgi:ABC-type uncharacterized transport system ATPase subunit